jgi:hypothetical protein
VSYHIIRYEMVLAHVLVVCIRCCSLLLHATNSEYFYLLATFCFCRAPPTNDDVDEEDIEVNGNGSNGDAIHPLETNMEIDTAPFA